MSVGLILDIGHAGKPSPRHYDRGAIHGQRVEADLAEGYVNAAAELARQQGVHVSVLRPPAAGWDYARRHREAIAVAKGTPGIRWLYAQAHLNSAERDARYGLVGYDPRSEGGKAAAGALATALEKHLKPLAIDRARAEAAEGDWSRMLGTIEGIWAGPDNLSGVCFEPAFIQSDFWARPDAPGLVGLAIVEGVQVWPTNQ